MRKITALILLSACLLGLCGCGGGTSERCTIGPGRPLAPVIGDYVTEVAVTHTLMGQDKCWTVTGEEITLLSQWAAGLKYKYVEFEPGNTPGDSDGGEAYTFRLTPDENDGGYPGFSYVKNGPDDCWLLMEGCWFSVSNPSYPPVSEPETASGGRVEDVYYTAPKLTIDTLKRLVELRGEDLGWSDLMLYEHKDVGSGLYIWQYPIDDTLCLVISGVSPELPPAYVTLSVVDEDGFVKNSIDPRTEDIDDFINSLNK